MAKFDEDIELKIRPTIQPIEGMEFIPGVTSSANCGYCHWSATMLDGETLERMYSEHNCLNASIEIIRARSSAEGKWKQGDLVALSIKGIFLLTAICLFFIWPGVWK